MIYFLILSYKSNKKFIKKSFYKKKVSYDGLYDFRCDSIMIVNF